MGFILITNAIEPYYQDCVNILAQYRGANYRFRYARQPDDYMGGINPSTLNGSSGLIVFRNWASGKLVPIRGIRIGDVTSSRRLAVIPFELGDFPDPRAMQNWGLLDEAVVRAGCKNSPDEGLKQLVFEAENSVIDKILGAPLPRGRHVVGATIDRWLAVIDSVSDFALMGNCCFLYLHTVRDASNKAVDPVEAKGGAIGLTAGVAYQADIIGYVIQDPGHPEQTRDSLEKPVRLKLETDKDVVVAIKGAGELVSRYDNLRFSFRPKSLLGEVGTVLEISPEEGSSTLFVPTLSLDLYVRFARWQQVSLCVGVLSFLGAAYLTFRNHLVLASITQAVGITLMLAPGGDLVQALIKGTLGRLFRRGQE